MAPTVPLVSIGIPTFNRSSSLRRAIASAVSQDYANLEVVISDNASTDSTEDTCTELGRRDERIRYIRQQTNRGIYANFADVLAHARGEYFMWLSDDDWLDPSYVSQCAGFLNKHLDYSLVCGKDRYFRGDRFAFEGPTINLPQDSPRERVISYFRSVSWNGMLFGVMRRNLLSTCGLTPVLGGDWLLISSIAYLGKTRTLETVSINRSASGDSGDMEKHALHMGLSPRQAMNPHPVIARGIFRDIGWESPTYRSLGRLSRLRLAARSAWEIFWRFGVPSYPSQADRLLAQPCRRFLDRHITWRFHRR